MSLPFFQIDAFTNRLFGGNPAGVVLLQKPLPDHVLQGIAAENNLAETAFPLEEDGGWSLRWFTPTLEIDLCGHATLATAYVLFKTGRVQGDSVEFYTQSGPLSVRREGDLLAMDFPSRPAELVKIEPLLVEALGKRPVEAWISRDLMAVFDSEEDVQSLRPDMGRLSDLEAFAVIATAPGRESDFVSRFFAPKAGIPEDPVTGSAHCTLTPYWSRRLGRQRLQARQISPRGGELLCEDMGGRVRLSGRAVEYLRGEIEIPA